MTSIHQLLYIRAGTLCLFAFYFLFIGLYGLLLRKPLVVSLKWTFALVLVIFLPTFATPFLLPSHNAKLDVMLWTMVPLLGFVLVLFWQMAKSYSFYGTDDGALRKALLAALDRLGLKSTEDSTGVHLADSGLTVKLSVIMGMGQMRIRGLDSQDVIPRLMPVLREELSKPGVEVSLMPFLFNLMLGATFGVISFTLLNLF